MKLLKKNILIVGANGGLALETIKHLIKDGARSFTLACRTQEKSEYAKNLLLTNVKEASLCDFQIFGGFDMQDQASIEKHIDLLPHKVFDIVFLAVGGIIIDKNYQYILADNTKIEKTAYQNLFGAHIVLNNLIKKNLIAMGARVVYAGGEGARGIPGMIEKPEFDTKEELRKYLYLNSSKKYSAMNAIGVSKFLGALWTLKISAITDKNFDIVWFSPGLTYGTNGLSNMSAIKRWGMENIGFGLMRLIGKAQSPAEGGRKFADCLSGTVGKNGEILIAPEKQTLGTITDQTPMNSTITKPELKEELWKILAATTGEFAI